MFNQVRRLDNKQTTFEMLFSVNGVWINQGDAVLSHISKNDQVV